MLAAVSIAGCSALEDSEKAADPQRESNPERWESLGREIAEPWVERQRADGTFADRFPATFPERYGESVLGYALLQTGVRSSSPELIEAGMDGIDAAVAPGGGSPRPSPFENAAVAGAYNLARERLGDLPAFRRSRPRWEAWLRGAELTRLPERSYYGNKHLVDAVAVLELLRTGLRSGEARAVLGGDRARARSLALEEIGERVPRLARAGDVSVAGGRAFVLSDPPTNPLAYQGLSLGFYARAIELLRQEAPAAARRTLAEVTRASLALTAPDGDLAYFGRSQEQSWALPFTAYGAEVAAAGRADPTLRGLAERALARLEAAHGGGPSNLSIIPALRRDPRAGRLGLDRYALDSGYTGLTLMALNWWLAGAHGEGREPEALPADADGSRVLGRGESAFATVRRGDVWMAVKSAPPERLGDLRYGFGLAAVKIRGDDGTWKDLMPLLPKTRRGVDSPGPVLLGDGEPALPFGTRTTTEPDGAVTVTGGWRKRSEEQSFPTAEFRYEPLPCGARVAFPVPTGRRVEYSTFVPDGERAPEVRGQTVLQGERVISFSRAATVSLERGYASGSEPRLTRVRLRFSPDAAGPVSVTYCRR